MKEHSFILALDYGGTKLSAGIAATGSDQWLASERTYAPKGANANDNQQAMNSMARRLVSAAGGKLAAIGISFGGPVDHAKGVVRLSHHTPGWEDRCLRDDWQREFEVPVAMDNDANVAALGEWSRGAGRGVHDLLYVTVSTGIGGGWILNRGLFRGADGMAGEIGHTMVNPDGEPCSCGKQGCLEAEACGSAIGRKAIQRLQQSDFSSVLRVKTQGNLEAITAAMVAESAAANDSFSIQLLEEAASFLGKGLAAAINLINPECIVLGGGVTKAGPNYWKVVRRITQAGILPQMRADLRPALLGDDAPLWGAVTLAEDLLQTMDSFPSAD